MKKIAIIGHFYEDEYISSGQTIRSQTIYKTIVKKYGINKVLRIDTATIRKTPFSSIFKLIYYYFKSNNLIIVSTLTGLEKFIKLYNFLYLMRKKNIIYIAIGNSIIEIDKSVKKKILKNINVVFVQTLGIKNRLKELGIQNVEILYNYRITSNTDEYIINPETELTKVCTFSRVSKEKGVTFAIKTVKQLNSKYNKNVEIDIYGTIEDDYKEEFYDLLANNSHAHYKGLVQESNICNVLSKYLLVLFPSTYPGEGFPGTILDSLRCGVPVVAMDWMYNSEIIIDNYNGHIIPINNTEKFEKSILTHLENKSFNESLRINCVKDSKKYSEERVFETLKKYIK